MTAPANNILIIGGGFSGMSAAIELRKLGLNVDLVEIDQGWRSYGAGISLGPATLRAFDTLGVLDAFLKQGAATDGVDLLTPAGQPIATLPTPRIARPDVPGGGAIMRPVLAKILADATRKSGANVRLGCTFTSITQDADGVDVVFTDSQRRRYDMVIGADGLFSKVREAVLPDAPKPRYTHQAVWRAVLPRPAEIQRATMWLGLPKIKPGVNPVSATEMYMFITEDRPTNDYIEPANFVSLFKQLLAPFPAPLLQSIRANISESSQIVYRPLEGMLVKQPWYKGRVVLIGDTVHATTPHLASGACIGIEDAIVLADELKKASSVQGAFEAFQKRRWDRCRMVVENSGRLGELEVTGGDKAEQQRIMGMSMAALNEPI
jgi:2-polyprenyl-6-methoxyphenol hydroxylase-like FAD-dependent oxidoreductase